MPMVAHSDQSACPPMNLEIACVQRNVGIRQLNLDGNMTPTVFVSCVPLHRLCVGMFHFTLAFFYQTELTRCLEVRHGEDGQLC